MIPSAQHGSFIAGTWSAGGGQAFSRHDPAEGRLTWEGNAASMEQISNAVAAAQAAAPAWARLTSEQRAAYFDAFARALAAHRDDMLGAICLETGRPRWEVRTEYDALLSKIDLSKKALLERRGTTRATKDSLTSTTRYKPLGVAAVLGPFNLPAHLPNGHIVPALLAGNTVVFKPSELTPSVGTLYARCWEEAALPAGVFNMIHGGREQGAALATHAGVDAVLFTGSRAAGVALSTALAPHPEKLLALEMGGNNPLVATRIGNRDAAALTIIQSAFITAGQRCTCARRLILMQDAEGDRLLERVLQMAAHIRVGAPSLEPEPFMGPVISDAAAVRLQHAYADLVARGATPLLALRSPGPLPAMLSPAILDVSAVAHVEDEELFGPLLQVIRVPDFAAAIRIANQTRYGLAAALLSDDAALYEQLYASIRAGIINWNRPTTGASSALPFGGVGASGNHRPAGNFAIDYCNDPVASLESPMLTMPQALPPGITL
jgi:succinylglutamic semialdehyde dehydrogenase